jgi:spore coat-associated protein N
MDERLQEMIAPAPSRSDMARRRRLVSTFVIVALAVVGIASLTTSALFTDNEAITLRFDAEQAVNS